MSFVIIDSCGFTLMPLQKCLLFKKIYKKHVWINTCFWLSGHNAELGKTLKNSNRETDGFIKLLTERNSYIGLNKLANVVIISMVSNTWKDAQHHSLSEKCKSRPQWGTISHRSEWLQPKSLQTIDAGEGVEKREPSYHCWWECKLVQPLWKSVEIP